MINMILFIVVCVILGPFANAQGPIYKPDPLLSPQLPPNATLRDGDMALTAEQEWAMSLGPFAYNAIIGEKYRWKDAIIPYEIDCSIENFPRAVAAIKAAMAQWERKTCIRFVPHTNQEFHLTFFRNTHCWGNVGQVSYSHISVGPGCDYEHVMAHEIGHVIGLYHEQNRKDRDEWIEVLWDNIGQFKDAFEIKTNTDALGVPYDYESIMHYPWSAFSSNGKDTMRPKKATHGKVPYVEISKDDIRLVSKMYKCNEVVKKREEEEKQQQQHTRHRVSRVPHPKFRDVVPNKFNRWDCIDTYRDCESWAKSGACINNPTVRKACKRSCIASTCYGSDCKDGHFDCPSWAKMGHCKFVDSVQADCQKSCNPTCKHQPTPKPTKKPSPTSVKPTHREPTTINTRTHPTIPPQPPTTPDPHHNHTKWHTWPNRNFLGTGSRCWDWYKKCPDWARQGECERNEGWMLENCKASCPKARCDATILKPPGQCVEPLGLSIDLEGNYKIPDSAMTQTSQLSPGAGWHAAGRNARLYMEDDYNDLRIGAWCPITRDITEYVQVDLGQVRTISYIATQGRPNFFERTSQFKIDYSLDGKTYKTFQEKGVDRKFWGNCDHATPVLNLFEGQMKARYVRYHPLDSNWPCVRMEFYGC